MRFGSLQRANLRLASLLTADSLQSALYWVIAVLTPLYLVVAVHTPIALYPEAPLDDGLFMWLGWCLAQGHWLGAFNQLTLTKGPGYPAFLAVAYWFGIPASSAQALFHCAAVTAFTAVAHRFIRSALLSASMFALLLWQPVLLTVALLRILREEIYSAQLLLVLALLVLTLFCAPERRQRMLLGAGAGAMLGWLWLTREEGVWIVPAFAVLLAVAVLHAFRVRQLGELFMSVLVVLGIFAVIQVGFAAVNWRVYGKFVGVDFKERNFQRALGALHSVRSGKVQPFVSVTRETRQRIYSVSPTFKSLESTFEASAVAWAHVSCDIVPSTCGEVGSGWFMWALRDAVSLEGHYSSPAQASEFFGRLADEIEEACEQGKLECKAQLFPEMPPVDWGDVAARLPAGYARAFNMLTRTSWPLHVNPSGGSEPALAFALRFLNNTAHRLPGGMETATTYTLNGWYYKSAAQWFSVKVTRLGSPVDARVERRASPDLPAFFNDPAATNQRFTIRTACNDQCVLTFETPEGEKVERRLGELPPVLAGTRLGDAFLTVESTAVVPDFRLVQTRIELLSDYVRTAIVANFHLVFLPVLALGLVAFVAASLRYWRALTDNVCYVLALACGMLVFLRASLLVLIDVTSFPALYESYLAPAYFMAAAAAVLSIAAWFQLSVPAAQSADHATAHAA